jgi:hypothetical protein
MVAPLVVTLLAQVCKPVVLSCACLRKPVCTAAR